MNMPQITSGWDGFLRLLKNRSPMLSSQLRMAELRSVKDNLLELFFGVSGHASLELVNKADNLKVIRESLREHYRTNLIVKFGIDRQKEDAPLEQDDSKAPPVDAKDLVANSPRLKSLLEKVDGEIVGVRKADD